MSETYARLDPKSTPKQIRSWVLVIGGISRDGNRRARRASREAAATGRDVVWLDGYEELDPENPGVRLPISELNGDGEILILGFRADERRHILNRLSFGEPRTRRPSENDEDDENGSGVQPRGGLLAKFARKINQAVRGYLIWRRLRGPIRSLHASSPDPHAIVYSDDHSIPTAWHSVRLWTNVPADMELLDR